MKTRSFTEDNCIFTHEGKSYESGGAQINDDGRVIGYVKGTTLTTWHGKPMGFAFGYSVACYRDQDGERTRAMVFISEDTDTRVAGYSFGEGGLFRGRIVDADENAGRVAREESEYFIQLDADDAAQAEADADAYADGYVDTDE